MNNLIIGIAGGSGSGKTTLAYRLKERFGEDEVRLISHDSYYKRHDELPFAERCKLNYDHPDAFDNDLLIEHLKELKAGHSIECPVYDYADHNRSNEVQHIEPAPVLIVEGILPLAEPELCKLFDYKIYVDTDADERILRRILRDVKERGRSLDSVINQYRATVKPMHEAFVEPSKRNADIIVSAAGVLNSLTKDFVRPGQVVIDVSINWDANKPNAKGGLGGIAGDAKFDEVEPIVDAITPVPGGVGSVTTSVLMKHVVEAAEKL